MDLPGKDETLIFTSTSHSSHCVDQMRIPIAFTVSRRSRMCPKRLTTSDLYLTSFRVVVISEFVFCCLYVFYFTIFTTNVTSCGNIFLSPLSIHFVRVLVFPYTFLSTRRRLMQMSAHSDHIPLHFSRLFQLFLFEKGRFTITVFSTLHLHLQSKFLRAMEQFINSAETFPTQ